MSSPQLLQVLSRLVEGHSIVLRFSSSKELESFRQAIYKVKKSWDDEMVQLDETWIVKQLNFEKKPVLGKEQEPFLDVKLWLSIPAPRGFKFEILEDIAPTE